VLTACFIGTLILSTQYGHQAVSVSGFSVLSLLYLLGLLVTADAMVWATGSALQIKQRVRAIGLVLGTLALVPLTLFTLPCLLVLVFAQASVQVVRNDTCTLILDFAKQGRDWKIDTWGTTGINQNFVVPNCENYIPPATASP
jgi:hypothetical protein